MNIVILGSAYPLRGGGLATFNERLARAFQQAGDDVTIYTFSLQYPAFLFPGTSQYSSEPSPTDLAPSQASFGGWRMQPQVRCRSRISTGPPAVRR